MPQNYTYDEAIDVEGLISQALCDLVFAFGDDVLERAEPQEFGEIQVPTPLMQIPLIEPLVSEGNEGAIVGTTRHDPWAHVLG